MWLGVVDNNTLTGLPISRVCVLRAVCIAGSTCVSARSAVCWQRARATITDHTYTNTVTAQLYTTRATTDGQDKSAPGRKKKLRNDVGRWFTVQVLGALSSACKFMSLYLDPDEARAKDHASQSTVGR